MQVTASQFLPPLMLLPLAAALGHGLLRANNSSHARVDLVFQWVYGALLALIACAGLKGDNIKNKFSGD